jgi:nitrogen-specific signal transduction histidine kinase
VRDAYRTGDLVYRIRGLFKEAPSKKERGEINGAMRDVLELTRDEATKDGVSVLTHLAEPSPTVHADRVQLQQVILNLIVRRAPRWLTADGRDAGAHSALRRRYLTLSNACPKGISNFVRCVRSLGLLGRPSTRGCPDKD